jgi:GGDEF domain-containing protein
MALKMFAKHIKNFGFRKTDILANAGGDEFIILLTDASIEIPYDRDNLLADGFNQTAEGKRKLLWAKIEKFIKSTRCMLIEGTNKHGERFHDLIRARVSAAEYNSQITIADALKKTDIMNETLKKWTKEYVPGGR